MQRYDSIVVGAGPNGLVCAAYLAAEGQRVLVLEALEVVGGLASSREFHPGFSARPAHNASHFPGSIARDLDLARHGASPLAAGARLVGLNRDGASVVLAGDAVTGVDPADAEALADYGAMMGRFAGVLDRFWSRTIPPIGGNDVGEVLTFAQLGLKLRRLGKPDMREFLRIASLPVRDLMDERFDSELLKATLCWDGLVGSRMAPRSPNGPALMLLYRQGELAYPVADLIAALETAAAEAGAALRTGARVSSILIDEAPAGPEAVGVELANGECLAADRVVSSVDPKTTFFELVGVNCLDIGFTNRIRRIRSDGLLSKLHLALDDLPRFVGLDDPSGRLLMAPTMDSIEFAFDDAKYGEYSAEPVLEVAIPTLDDRSLAPPGKHVLSAHVSYTPYALKGGWSEAARQDLAERAIGVIEAYCPGIRQHIIASELLSPADLEARYGVKGGHWHHGDFAMDQMLMMRPTYGAAQYRTPIPGLWLCGAGSHPAGDVTGLAGHNAAREILS